MTFGTTKDKTLAIKDRTNIKSRPSTKSTLPRTCTRVDRWADTRVEVRVYTRVTVRVQTRDDVRVYKRADERVYTRDDARAYTRVWTDPSGWNPEGDQ